MKKLSLVLFVACAVWFVGATAPTPAQACTCYCDHLCIDLGDCCPDCGDGDIDFDSQVTVSPLGDNGVRVHVIGALSLGMAGATSCAAGMPDLGELGSVDSIKLLNLADGGLIYEFFTNPAASASFGKLDRPQGPRDGGHAQWAGFHAYVESDVPTGLVTSFQIDITLGEGVNLWELVWALRTHGALGGGSAHADGELDFHHLFLRNLGDMNFKIGPALER